MDLIQLSREKGFMSKDKLIKVNVDYKYLWMCELQKWLREKHNLFISITHRIQGNIDSFLVDYSYNGNNGQWNNIYYTTYEECLENAIVEYLHRISETVL